MAAERRWLRNGLLRAGWAKVPGAGRPAGEFPGRSSFGGFKTVELNWAGWGAVLGPGAAVGGVVAGLAGGADWVALGVVTGMALAFGAARIADEIRDRRRRSYIPVAVPAEAEARLRDAGIPMVGQAEAEVRGRRVRYVAVRVRDAEQAADLVGLPRESRRAQRRWKFARWAALGFGRRR